jgi:hypothetical protein
VNPVELHRRLVDAGVPLEDVDVTSLYINTDGCNCPISEIGEHPETICWKPEEHFVWEVQVGHKWVELPW